MSSVAPPRRFEVEPLETTASMSEGQSQEQIGSSKPPRTFPVEPVETSTTNHRKLVPEPTETAPKMRRRFSPQLVGTSGRNSREKFAEEWATETTKSSNHREGKGKETGSGRRSARRFAPLLIETARRSRKSGDSAPVVLPSDKTEATPAKSARHRKTAHFEPIPPPPDNTPTTNVTQNPLFLEIQRATSPQAGRRPMLRKGPRCHSFRVPELDPITSSESEASNPPSPLSSRLTTTNNSCMYKEATRMRESVDERFSGYLLELAARAAEKQLREQAMAAYPNDDHHEQVDHFIGRDSDDEPSHTEPRSQRSPFNQVNWDLLAMQEHQKKLELQQELKQQRNKPREVVTNKPATSAYSPWGNPIGNTKPTAPRNGGGGPEKDAELTQMRKGARPPMLGSNIKFPRCPSPEPARFDPTQGCDAVRIAMCYLSEQSQVAEKGESLWCGLGDNKHASRVPSLWSSSSRPLPPTPPASNTDFACIDEKLTAELSMEEEFGDDFVTQVYNYLSLGYPSMAWPFDAELSKISQISIAELRQDDHLARTRGYIRLGQDGNLADAEITEESCMRWRALRTYIRVWAKQHPGMTGEKLAGGMGTAVRRGSWAI
ncbi:hypothetical protein BDV95DRAFT_498733 [Massariosphaeria phaeospora]|uniref:Uncharacterized protein n=1 Tax=Massariosphaeria phaeospora TaxID=100035 RepID=A0A7C8I2R3_9PLEO|nr:hypothetical protein BDV95DRAFT_498733 [Massariosphaeria phaeospora]